MTCKELQQKLEEYPDDLEVKIYTEVEYLDGYKEKDYCSVEFLLKRNDFILVSNKKDDE